MKTYLISLLILLFGIIIVSHPASAKAAVNQSSCSKEMVFIPGGTFTIGSENKEFFEERSANNVTVDSFCMDRHEVTNGEFAQFVQATGYKTVAEQPLSQEQFPSLSEEERAAGSLVFLPPSEGIEQIAYLSWWHWVPGANWQHPYGADSNIEGKENYPVVHIAYEDALAYGNWVGKMLPTEAQWEYAARGGLKNKIFSWGNEYSAQKANTWQGFFPFFNTKEDGYLDTASVESFPPNGYGLYDMTGNVWEWTSDWFSPGHLGKAKTVNPTGPSQERSFDPKKPNEGALHVIKGGSYLCAKNYCSRYRPGARESQAPDTGATHIGFRLVSS